MKSAKNKNVTLSNIVFKNIGIGSRPVFAGMSAALADWRKVEGLRWMFIVRVLTIAFATLWLAYRLELDSPATSVITVFIVALPSSGMILEKALFRLIGTLIGCCAALILIGLLPQAAPLLFICLALWVGLCTCGAAMIRNSKSYGFLLAGYTACMIVIPSINDPSQLFTLAVTRVSEVGLGILCSVFISDALFPSHQSDLVMQAVKGRYERLIALCRDTLENKLAPAEAEVMHLRFAADVAALESSRSAAFFEAAQSYGESRNLHIFNSASMAALTTFYTLHRLLHRMRQNSSAMVVDLTEAICRCFLSALDSDPAEGSAEAVRLHIRERAERLRKEMIVGDISDMDRIGLDTIIELLDRFAKNIYDFQVVYFAIAQKKRLPQSDWPFHTYAPTTPFPIVFASGIRAALALLGMAAVWYYLAWAPAAVALLMTVIFTALAASSPNPTKMIQQIVTGFVIGVPLAFICDFFLMVHAEGFPMLMLCIAPFVMVGTYLMTMPKFYGIGLGLNLFLAQLIFPENAVRTDPALFFDNCIALLAGGALAWVVYVLVLPRHTVGQKEYITGALWREALRTCTSARPESPQRFDNRVRDLLNQLNAAAGPVPDAQTRAAVGLALTLLELGHSVINMREMIAIAPSTEVRATLRECVAHMAAFLRSPNEQHRDDILETILEAGRLVRETMPGVAPERLARLKVVFADLHSLYTLMLDHEQLMPTPVQTSEGDHRVA